MSTRLSGLALRVVRLGLRMPMQVLWRLDGPVDHEALATMHRNLLAGPLNRRVRFARVPFARPVWSPSAEANPVRISGHTVRAAEVLDWADAAAAADLDVARGLGWELTATAVDDGTSIVSLVCSHALTDGQGLLAILTLAARDEHRAEPAAADRPSLIADANDALRGGIREHTRLAVLRATAGGTTRSPVAIVRNTVRSTRTRRAPDQWRSTVAVQVDTATIERIATENAGTATGLTLAILANVARRARGEIAAADPLAVAVPVSLRAPDDPESSNAMAIATVALNAQDGRYTDLTAVRQCCKAAYSGVAAGDTALGHTDAGFSSVGVFPAEARTAFGPALGVIGRAISNSGLRRGHVFVFATWGDGTTSLWFQATGIHLDRTMVGDEFDAWGIDVSHWW
ncbi:hypothetical protein [Nocardia sp. NPDC052566]|uniref:hypothetical protein n=1 Tax=Nocardia sp. NPDC052566 TaxID=3364330 RepID=UPI0037C9C8BE